MIYFNQAIFLALVAVTLTVTAAPIDAKPTSCISGYNQCAGQNFVTDLPCCYGYECTGGTQWWVGCQPKLCIPGYNQCGGQGFVTDISCCDGFECTGGTQWWVGCQPVAAHVDVKPKSCIPGYSQCGGQGFVTDLSCCDGYECTGGTQWWVGCQPAAAPDITTPPPTPTTTTVPITTTVPPGPPVTGHAKCRPQGLYKTEGLDVPYCTRYDEQGREKMGLNHSRRVIGYFTSWRTGAGGTPTYLVNQIPWDKITHVQYAFAHVGSDHKISVGNVSDPNNVATGLTWPGVDVDPGLEFRGHFGALATYKQRYNVSTLISVGGWAESGGHLLPNGTRVFDGGFYSMTTNPDGTTNTAAINTFARSCVNFIRKYKFDGVDIDYEYASSMGWSGNPDDFEFSEPHRGTLMQNYMVLMKALREELDQASVEDDNHYLLTIASPSSGYLLRGMETMRVTDYLDFVTLMTYDLHGSWNEFVGHNAPLFDTGLDNELAHWDVYTEPLYKGVGYLNADWAYHYFRGAISAGRINIGIPYYTRGWKGVTGGQNGLWGNSPMPNQDGCAPGTGMAPNNKCGEGATGINNLWHDKRSNGLELGSGSNPMWHAKNLENGIYGSYLPAYGFPAHGAVSGNYARHYDSIAKASWLWNEKGKVFLSTEDSASVNAKIEYVADKGIGGLMMWELAGDYNCYHLNPNNTRGEVDLTENACHQGTGEYFIGNTLTTAMYEGLRHAAPYGNNVAPEGSSMPTAVLDMEISVDGFKIGDENYPLNPLLTIKNNGNLVVPGGSEIRFTYGTSAPDNMRDQTGFNINVQSGHPGSNNIGGLRGDFHEVSFRLPHWQTLPPGQSISMTLNYYLPISTPSNWRVNSGGTWYGLLQEYPDVPIAL